MEANLFLLVEWIVILELKKCKNLMVELKSSANLMIEI